MSGPGLEGQPRGIFLSAPWGCLALFSLEIRHFPLDAALWLQFRTQLPTLPSASIASSPPPTLLLQKGTGGRPPTPLSPSTLLTLNKCQIMPRRSSCMHSRPSEKNGSLFSLLSGTVFHLLAGKELESGFPFIYLYGFVSILRHMWSLSCLKKCVIKQVCWGKAGVQCRVQKVMSHSGMAWCQICIKREAVILP